MSKNLSELSGRKGLDKNLFEEFGRVAAADGTPSLEDLEQLREEFLVGKANVYGAVSFYDFLREENRGKKAYVCNGSACMTAGTQHEVHQHLHRHFSKQEIGEMCCLGRCHENSAFHIHGKNYSGNDIHHLDELISTDIATAEQYHVSHSGTPILTAEQPNPEKYYQTFIEALNRDAGLLLEELKVSGLRGRGGAGFPMATKLESCRNTESDIKFIVCNADEGDPGAFSDRYILEQRPHALLMGMMIAGFIVGANRGVIYIRGEYPESVDAINKAIRHLEEMHFTGEKIGGSNFDFHFKVIKAQGAYICGEETALLNSIEGQRPEVRTRPPYPTQQGLFNKPTVVNNVETLANLPYIIHHGGKAFAAIGVKNNTGTKLLSLDGHFNRPGIYEVDMGTPLRTVIDDLAGGFRVPVKAMHIGGPLGGLVPVSKINDLSMDFDTFSKEGFLLGHASIICIPEKFPMIEYIEHLFRFTAHESCGKCFPCRLGSVRGYEMIDKARDTYYKMDRQLFNDLLDTMERGSLCALGGGLPLPVKNAMKYFEEELNEYFYQA